MFSRVAQLIGDWLNSAETPLGRAWEFWAQSKENRDVKKAHGYRSLPAPSKPLSQRIPRLNASFMVMLTFGAPGVDLFLEENVFILAAARCITVHIETHLRACHGGVPTMPTSPGTPQACLSHLVLSP